MAGQPCIFRQVDKKRTPIPQEHARAMEDRIAWLESTLKALKVAPPEMKEIMLQSLTFEDHLSLPRIDALQDPIGGSEWRSGRAFLQPTTQGAQKFQSSLISLCSRSEAALSLTTQIDRTAGSLVFHGPTSMYQGALSSEQSETGQRASPMPRAFELNHPFDLNEGVVRETLSLFFRWQYPHFMFIYREAFLREHLQHVPDERYWSLPLLYAVCALGATMSPDKDVKAQSNVLYMHAEDILMNHRLDRPHITTIQAFLCLSFHNIGRGNHSKGWLYSGLAFRMGQDIGFQYDPKYWISSDLSIASDEDIEIRRRIFWGCFMSDKIISLFLGRPTFLHEGDADVEPTEPLSDPPELYVWLVHHNMINSDTEPRSSPKFVATFKNLVQLSKIVQYMLSRIFSLAKLRVEPDDFARLATLDELNLTLCHWSASLPDELRWNRWKPANTILEPHVGTLHILFHSVRICMNRNFIKLTRDGPWEDSPWAICTSSSENIVALLRHYRKDHSLRYSPLLFVYGAVVSASFLLLVRDAVPHGQSEPQRSALSFLLLALSEQSVTWELAGEAERKLRSSLNQHRKSHNAAPRSASQREARTPCSDAEPTPVQTQYGDLTDSDARTWSELSGGNGQTFSTAEDEMIRIFGEPLNTALR
ncbi:hypothetical protein A1O1_00640 [Capronia coronata CBS 617.96]|uniref:Xylanolytic transcriptional activator regulatory domain-containing protein n=1 Tax=Capronia coronata CBS 617.96 TaxID=1182541 RepID=W9YSK7_9EURO|nr:uncharacterized protein A1O1_00640 [Capronia coronata CBS 617.96]EXJ95518.1 hypothetical protein A1O1_00640 [Capronia coronata CBS 617.96]